MDEINKREKKRYYILLAISLAGTFVVFVISITIGQYNISLRDFFLSMGNILFGMETDVSQNDINVISLIRIPRTIAAFIVGSSLAISGCSFQSMFNNPLVSPDMLGVSAGACVGAAISILLGASSGLIGISAFAAGLVSVIIALLLPKLFRSNRTVTLVLSGIIVGSLMNSIIGLIKFLADKNEKLAEITFWIMGQLRGVTYNDILSVLPIYLIAVIGIMLLRWKINILSLGQNEAKSLGLKYTRYRFLVVAFSTLLTASAVSISGNVGWIGLVVPHISRAIVGSDNRYAIPISGIFGGTFLMLVDLLARNVSISEIPLSIITGLIGSVIYAIVLVKRGNSLYD